MTASQFATTTLWLASLAIPALVFLLVNAKSSRTAQLSAAIIAMATGWCCTIAYAIAAQSIARAQAPTQEAQLALLDSDGAPLAFAATFGWVPAAVVVTVVWFVRRTLIPRIKGL
jgi:hypothetical protein